MRACVASLAFCLVAAALAPAAAQTEADTREARRHMEVGQEYFLQERWEEAAEAFLAAFDAREHSAFLFNAAVAYHRLGAAARAVDVYRRYLAAAPTAPDRADVEERIRVLERAAASAPPAEPEAAPEAGCEGDECPEQECLAGDESCQTEPTTPTPAVRIERVELDAAAAAAGRRSELRSVVFVEVEPADATVVLLDDGGAELFRGQAPLEHTTEPGRYSLVLEHPEYRQVRTPVHVRAGRVYVFHIEMSQPPAFLSVTANVPGATVYLDDRSVGPVGTTPWGDVVRTGVHRLWIERPGYEPEERRVEIALGQEEEVTVELERLAFGMVRVLSNVDEALVEVDGEEVGVAPLDHQLPPGEHEVRVHARGMKDYRTTVTVARGQTTRVLVRLNPRPSRVSAWVSLGFTAVVFAASGVLGWYSAAVFRDLEDSAQTGRLADDDDRALGGFLFALGADVGFALGTAVAAVTLYYFLRDPLPDSEGRTEDPVDFTENPGSEPVAEDRAEPSALAPLGLATRVGTGAWQPPRLSISAGGLRLRF